MESLNDIQEIHTAARDERSISRSPNRRKSKQSKKLLSVTSRDEQKTKSKTSKNRLSLAQCTQEKSNTLTFKSDSLKSKSCDQLSASVTEVKYENQSGDHAACESFAHLTLDKRYSDQSEAGGFQKNSETESNVNLTVEEILKMWKDADEKQLASGIKFTESHELDNIGIMNLSSMNITDNDIPQIIQKAFSEKKSKCVGLILRDNKLTSAGVKLLVDELLARRTKLKYLSLSNNIAVGDLGVEHLVRLLQKNRSITFLALPNTGMTNRGVRLLADAICGNSPNSSRASLEKLHISFNKLVTDESLEALLQIIEQNQTLKVLSVQHCSLSDDAREQLRQTSVKKKKKKKFDLSE